MGERRVAERQHACGKQGCVDGAGLADRERANRHAGRHLHDGVERIDALERLRFDRHPEHRQRRHGSRHAGQVCGPSGAGDDHFDAGRFGALGEGIEPLRRAVRRDDMRIIIDVERIQRLGGMAERRPVRLAPHDDRDRICPHSRLENSPRVAKEAADYRCRASTRKAPCWA